MQANGYLFLSVNDGPVSSIPVTIDSDKLVMELWYGDLDASTCDPSVRAVVEAVLVKMTDCQPEPART
jgi:hypothetical protein